MVNAVVLLVDGDIKTVNIPETRFKIHNKIITRHLIIINILNLLLLNYLQLN